MPQSYASKYDCEVIITLGPPATRTPSDEHVDKLRERRREITRKLGTEADALRAEAKQIDAALAAFDKAKPRKKGKR